jgi:hypothetical protein
MPTKQPNMRVGQLGRLGEGGSRGQRTLGFYQRPDNTGKFPDDYSFRIINVGEIFLYIETMFLELDPVTGVGWSNNCIIDVFLIGDELLYVSGQGHLEPLSND